MKLWKLSSLLMGCLVAVSLTSCMDNDSDPTGLTREQARTAYNTVKGNYSGQLLFTRPTTASGSESVTDSISVNWTVDTDSTLVIRNFPSEVLSLYVTDETIRTAIAEAGPRSLTCYVGYFNLSPVKFLSNPSALAYDVTYADGTSHKVTVGFLINSNYSFGVYSESSRFMQMQIVEGGIFVDQKATTHLSTSVAFLLKGKKEVLYY